MVSVLKNKPTFQGKEVEGMEDFILSILAGLVTSYITYLCSKIKNHFFNGRRKSGYEFEVKFKFKKF